MDVSNSTGENTGYRVLGSGTNMDRECLERECPLTPGQTEREVPVPPGPFRVAFFIDGEEVACANFESEPPVVSLRKNPWGLHVQPEEKDKIAS